jgi:hypothetical protein
VVSPKLGLKSVGQLGVVSGFRRKVNENGALLVYYAKTDVSAQPAGPIFKNNEFWILDP